MLLTLSWTEPSKLTTGIGPGISDGEGSLTKVGPLDVKLEEDVDGGDFYLNRIKRRGSGFHKQLISGNLPALSEDTEHRVE